jgi:hypothetical protein
MIKRLMEDITGFKVLMVWVESKREKRCGLIF